MRGNDAKRTALFGEAGKDVVEWMGWLVNDQIRHNPLK